VYIHITNPIKNIEELPVRELFYKTQKQINNNIAASSHRVVSAIYKRMSNQMSVPGDVAASKK